jgi:hypothetical protein
MKQQKQIVDVFLCHNGADKEWVRLLGEQIESETFSGTSDGRTLRVFFDEWDIDVGDNILLKLNTGLANARYVAVVISPEMLDAEWPAFEWTHLVAEDPTNRKGKLIPLLYRDYSQTTKKRICLPAPFKVLNWIDFRKPQNFNKSFIKLVRKLRDLPPARGKIKKPITSSSGDVAALIRHDDVNPAAPDAIQDLVLGNLLPVESHPTTLWHGKTDAKVSSDVYKVVENHPAFLLNENRLYTFADLTNEDEPLRQVIETEDIGAISVSSLWKDPVRSRWVMHLLNRSLRNFVCKFPIAFAGSHRYFFRPNKDNTDRVWQNPRDFERIVASRKTSLDGSGHFWVHHGSTLCFMALGERLFLQIDPCYVFTSDGKTRLEGRPVGPLSIKWGGKERNAAILRNIVFWSRSLSRGTSVIEVPTGGSPIVIRSIPAIAKTTFGIADDHIGLGSLLNQVEDELGLAAQIVDSSDAAQIDPENEDELK